MTTWPSRSTMCALISPTCSLTSVSIDSLAGEDALARFLDAGRAERIGRARPAERRLRALVALQQRRRRPLRLERTAFDPAVDGLKDGPGARAALRQHRFDGPPHVDAARDRHSSLSTPCRKSRRKRLKYTHERRSETIARRARRGPARRRAPPARQPLGDERFERPPVRLAAFVARQLVEEHERPRNLVRRQPRRRRTAASPTAAARGSRGTMQADELLAAAAGRARRGRARRRSAGMLTQHALDFVGLHLAAGDVDEGRDAARQLEPPVGRERPRSPVRKPPSTKPSASAVGHAGIAAASPRRRRRGRGRRPAARASSGADRHASRRAPASPPSDRVVEIVARVVADAAGLARAVERVDLARRIVRRTPRAVSTSSGRRPRSASRATAATPPAAGARRRCSNMNGTPGKTRAP